MGEKNNETWSYESIWVTRDPETQALLDATGNRVTLIFPTKDWKLQFNQEPLVAIVPDDVNPNGQWAQDAFPATGWL